MGTGMIHARDRLHAAVIRATGCFVAAARRTRRAYLRRPACYNRRTNESERTMKGTLFHCRSDHTTSVKPDHVQMRTWILPSKVLVIVLALGLETPRITIHMCCASMTTATPIGSITAQRTQSTMPTCNSRKHKLMSNEKRSDNRVWTHKFSHKHTRCPLHWHNVSAQFISRRRTLLNCGRNLVRQSLLYLQTARKHFGDARQLGQAEDAPTARNIPNVYLTREWYHVVLAQRKYVDVLDDNLCAHDACEFVVARDETRATLLPTRARTRRRHAPFH